MQHECDFFTIAVICIALQIKVISYSIVWFKSCVNTRVNVLLSDTSLTCSIIEDMWSGIIINFTFFITIAVPRILEGFGLEMRFYDEYKHYLVFTW